MCALRTAETIRMKLRRPLLLSASCLTGILTEKTICNNDVIPEVITSVVNKRLFVVVFLLI